MVQAVLLLVGNSKPKDGRYVYIEKWLGGLTGFNPRPPRRTGATC